MTQNVVEKADPELKTDGDRQGVKRKSADPLTDKREERHLKDETLDKMLQKLGEVAQVLFHADRIKRVASMPGRSPIDSPTFFQAPRYLPEDGKLNKEGEVVLTPQQQLEVVSTALLPGANSISTQDLKPLLRYEQGMFAHYCQTGIIEIKQPIASGRLTNTSADFNEGDAQQLIHNTDDLDWLKQCLVQEPRESIAKLLKNRIEALEKTEQAILKSALSKQTNSRVDY
jgi:hypothetical protein